MSIHLEYEAKVVCQSAGCRRKEEWHRDIRHLTHDQAKHQAIGYFVARGWQIMTPHGQFMILCPGCLDKPLKRDADRRPLQDLPDVQALVDAAKSIQKFLGLDLEANLFCADPDKVAEFTQLVHSLPQLANIVEFGHPDPDGARQEEEARRMGEEIERDEATAMDTPDMMTGKE